MFTIDFLFFFFKMDIETVREREMECNLAPTLQVHSSSAHNIWSWARNEQLNLGLLYGWEGLAAALSNHLILYRCISKKLVPVAELGLKPILSNTGRVHPSRHYSCCAMCKSIYVLFKVAVHHLFILWLPDLYNFYILPMSFNKHQKELPYPVTVA